MLASSQDWDGPYFAAKMPTHLEILLGVDGDPAIITHILTILIFN